VIAKEYDIAVTRPTRAPEINPQVAEAIQALRAAGVKLPSHRIEPLAATDLHGSPRPSLLGTTRRVGCLAPAVEGRADGPWDMTCFGRRARVARAAGDESRPGDDGKSAVTAHTGSPATSLPRTRNVLVAVTTFSQRFTVSSVSIVLVKETCLIFTVLKEGPVAASASDHGRRGDVVVCNPAGLGVCSAMLTGRSGPGSTPRHSASVGHR
jgi:hypothetical protein